jgi:hypothetical protein
MSLKQELYETLRRSNLKVSVIADKMGAGESHLYKATTPDSGVNFPLEWLIPLMNITKDYRVLEYVNSLCGFAAYKIPAGGLKKGLVSVAELQKLLGEVQTRLYYFYDHMNDAEKQMIDVQPIIKLIKDAIKALAAQKANVEKYAYGQTDLFEDGGDK